MQRELYAALHCIHSVVSNSQGIRNAWLEPVWEQHTRGDDTTQRG